MTSTGSSAVPGLLLVSALFVFIPGDSITMQAVELIDGSWTAGVARLFYSIMLLCCCCWRAAPLWLLQ